MVVKHEISSNSKIRVDQLKECCIGLNVMLRSVTELLNTLNEFRREEIDGADVLDVISYAKLVVPNGVKTFAIDHASSNDAINRVFRDLVGTIYSEEVSKIMALNNFTEACICDAAEPYGEELDKYIQLASDVAGTIAYLMLYEFGVLETSYALDKEENPPIDSALMSYLEQYAEEVNEYVNRICTVYAVCRPTLEVFDAYPELEESFLEKVGPYITDVDNSALTKEVVDLVLADKLDPAALYEYFHAED